jgi:hypothetical protein
MRHLLKLAALAASLTAGPAFAATTVQGEAGVQAFSGQLSDALRAGPAWGVTANIQPRVPVGLELRYQGASNQLYGSGNFWNGPREARVVSNGGEALVNLSMARSNRALVVPFVASGIGVNWFTLSDPVPGYRDDSVGVVPVSAGVNFNIVPTGPALGSLTLGLRGDYKFLFSDQFAPTDQVTNYGVFTKQGGDTYRGELLLGGTF